MKQSSPSPSSSKLVSKSFSEDGSNNKTYALPESPIVLWSTTIYSTLKAILLTPVLIPFGLIWSIAMTTPLKYPLLGMVVPRIMRVCAEEFTEQRKALLSNNVQGRVLDVGSGGGDYLDYCTHTSEVVAIEPLVSAHPRIREHGKSLKKLTILPNTLDEYFQEHYNNDGAMMKFDWIILGNILCEVEDVREALRQVDQLVKPGGYIYFSEHIARPAGTWKRWYQDLMNPILRKLKGGCNCNRDTLLEIEAMSGWEVLSWTYEHRQVCMGPFVVGLARKKL